MKKTFVSILLLLALLTVTSPAAADQKVRVGEKIDVFIGEPTTFPAGAPFHIAHGWIMLDSNWDGLGIWDFQLEVDGVLWKEDFVERSIESGDPDLHNRIWVFNFPEGLTGTHTFTGHWLGPCQVLVDDGTVPGPCSYPNDKVEARVSPLTVTFEP